MNYTLSIFNNIPTSRKCACLFLLSCLMMTYILPAQIYNYDPVRHNNIETNPSALAGAYRYKTFSFNQYIALLSNNQLSHTSLKVGLKAAGGITGTGFFLSRTRVNDSVHYESAGFALAWRTYVFNAMQLRLGAACKATLNSVSGGRFNYHSYLYDSTSRRRTEFIQNINLSASLSSPSGNLYVSAGLLNYPLLIAATETNTQFPLYGFIHIGDLGKMFMGRNTELNYTMLYTQVSGATKIAFSHFLHFSGSIFRPGRNSHLLFGLRSGAVENRYLQLCPQLDFYLRLKDKSGLRFGLLYDIGFSTQTLKKEYPAGTQFHLTWQL